MFIRVGRLLFFPLRREESIIKGEGANLSQGIYYQNKNGTSAGELEGM